MLYCQGMEAKAVEECSINAKLVEENIRLTGKLFCPLKRERERKRERNQLL